MDSIMEARLQIIIFLLFIHYLETLLLGPLQIGIGVSIHDKNVTNNFHPLLPEATYEKLSLLLRVLQNLWWIFVW